MTVPDILQRLAALDPLLAQVAETPTPPRPCCRETGWWFGPDACRCASHQTADDRALVAALDALARDTRAVPWRNGQAAWPYGPDHVVPMRWALLRWALPRQIRLKTTLPPDPLRWLLRQPRQQLGYPYWLDHCTAWVREHGEPAGVLGQPYPVVLDAATRAAIQTWAEAAGLRVEVGPAWYQLPPRVRTLGVALWRPESAPM